MREVVSHFGRTLFVLLLLAAGCDSYADDDRFDDFEGSWTVADLETADTGEDNFNSIQSRLESQYSEDVVFTFTQDQGQEVFDIFGNVQDGDDLQVQGDINLSSGNTLTLISADFINDDDIFADYRITGDQFIFRLDGDDAENLLDTFFPERRNPDDPEVRLTIERSAGG